MGEPKELTIDEINYDELLKSIKAVNKSGVLKKKIDVDSYDEKDDVKEAFLDAIAGVPDEKADDIPADVLKFYKKIVTGDRSDLEKPKSKKTASKEVEDDDDEEEKPKSKKKSKSDDDDDEEEEKPKSKKKEKSDDDDDDEDEKPKSKKKSKSDDDDDDDDDEDEKPKKKDKVKKEKKGKKEKKSKDDDDEEESENVFGFKSGSPKAVISDMFLEDGTTLKEAAAKAEKKFEKEGIKATGFVLGIVKKLIKNGCKVEVTISAKPKKS
jgi:hypothetical protein